MSIALWVFKIAHDGRSFVDHNFVYLSTISLKFIPVWCTCNVFMKHEGYPLILLTSPKLWTNWSFCQQMQTSVLFSVHRITCLHVCCIMPMTLLCVWVRPFLEGGCTFPQTCSGDVHSNDTATVKSATACSWEGYTREGCITLTLKVIGLSTNKGPGAF